MSVKRTIEERNGIFFVTFTCYKWLHLFEITNSYDLVYKWFDILISKGHQITGYVIMPNHLHALIALKDSNQTINTILSNAKRFMAYEIIRRLKDNNQTRILNTLQYNVTLREKAKGQKHKVFEESSDIKLCVNTWFIEQKLNYIHENPCAKGWKLADHPLDYRHSSMKFYEKYYPGIDSRLTPYTALFEDL